MEVVDFVASLPETPQGVQKLRRTLELFDSVRERIVSTDMSTWVTREQQDNLATELGADRFMVEDLARAIHKQTSPIFTDYVEHGFWTLGRQSPRFGTPWGGLTFNDINKSIDLLVRYDGSFEDEEDPSLWMSCPVTSVEGASYKKLSAIAATCNNLDLWWKVSGNQIVGKIVFR